MQLRRRAEPLSSTHGSNFQSGRIRSGRGSILQDNLSCGNQKKPYLPDNSFREWKRVTDRDWQHQGYQRILSRFESFSTHQAQDQSLVDVQNSDIIRVEEMFTYAPPISDGDRPTALQLPPAFYCDSRHAHRVVIFRSRLLSGFGQFRVLLAAVDILVNDGDTKLSM